MVGNFPKHCISRGCAFSANHQVLSDLTEFYAVKISHEICIALDLANVEVRKAIKLVNRTIL